VFDYDRGVLTTSADVENDAALAYWPTKKAENILDSPIAADLFVGSPKTADD
jgi:hypothetical protein